MPRLTLYLDWASPPARAVAWFLYASKVPFDVNEVRIAKNAHKTPEFMSVNPLGLVPAIKDADGTTMFESCSIVRYLAAKHNTPSNLYTSAGVNLKTHLAQEQFMDFYHLGIRGQLAPLFFESFLKSPQSGEYSEVLVKLAEQRYREGLATLAATPWFTHDYPFVTGDSPCFGDFLAFCELEQMNIADRPVLPVLRASHPRVAQWYDRLMLTDGYAASHDKFTKLTAASVARLRASRAAAVAKL